MKVFSEPPFETQIIRWSSHFSGQECLQFKEKHGNGLYQFDTGILQDRIYAPSFLVISQLSLYSEFLEDGTRGIM